MKRLKSSFFVVVSVLLGTTGINKECSRYEYSTNGCTNSDSVVVRKDTTDSTIVMPNIFTPNGDGKNDYFVFPQNNIIMKDFTMFNRWGKIIYHVQDNVVNWNGKQDNGIVDDGIYYWVGVFEDICD